MKKIILGIFAVLLCFSVVGCSSLGRALSNLTSSGESSLNEASSSAAPTDEPTAKPTAEPTMAPTKEPTAASESAAESESVSASPELFKETFFELEYDVPGTWGKASGDTEDTVYYYPPVDDEKIIMICINRSSAMGSELKGMESSFFSSFGIAFPSYKGGKTNTVDVKNGTLSTHHFTFTYEDLGDYEAVVYVHQSGDVLTSITETYPAGLKADDVRSIVANIVSGLEESENEVQSKAASETDEKQQEKKTGEGYTAELASGFYTVGTDIPAGKYNLTAVSGNGNVMSDDFTLNIIMGVDTSAEMYEQEFKNAKLENGVIVDLRGVTVKFESKDAAPSSLSPRVNKATKEYEFSSGNYVAGEDFEPGTYTLIATSGAGNVTTDDFSLNAIMGKDQEDDMYLKEYKNVNLTSGVMLKVAGVGIKLVPSK